MSLDVLLIFGIILLMGLSVAEGARRIKAPQVVGFIIAGVLIGPTVFNILDPAKIHSLVPITSFALAIIGFNIGSELQWKKIKSLGKSITLIVIFESLFAFAFVAIGIYLLTGKPEYGLIFGSLAAATAPAATVDVIYEYKAKGPLTTTLLAVVGLDDAMAILIYAFALSFAKSAISPEIQLTLKTVLIEPLIEIVGSIGIGTAIGLLFIFIAKRIQNKIKLLTLIIGTLFIAAGISIELKLSMILTSMAIGITVSNASPHSAQKVIEPLNDFAPPIYIIFFSLVGARLNLRSITHFGTLSLLIVGIYVVLRAGGKYIGVLLGAYLSKAQQVVRKYLGFALFSQAGVAIGLAILSANQLSLISEKGKQLAALIVLVITLTTFIVQMIGPPLVKYALFKAKENSRV